MKLEELIAEFYRINDSFESVNKSYAQMSNKDEKLSLKLIPGIKGYLSQAFPVLVKVCKLSRGDMIVVDNRVYHKNLVKQNIPFTYENAYELVSSSINNINNSLKTLSQIGYDAEEFIVLGKGLNALYSVYDNIEAIENNHQKEIANLNVDVTELENQKQELQKELHALGEKVVEYETKYKNKYVNMSIDEYINDEGLVDYQIPLGYLDSQIDEKFLAFAKEACPSFSIECTPICLDKNHPVYFLETEEDLLTNDYYDLILERIIHNAYLHFPAKQLQVAFIENKINSPVLKPILNNINLAVSSSLAFSSEVANDESSATNLINKLFNEYNDRISKFKSFRGLSKYGKCDDIYDYNKENPSEPVKFIFFIYKDYPSFCSTEENRRMLTKLIEGGAHAGIFILLIGNNIEIKPKYMGDKPIEKLDLAKLNTRLVDVTQNAITLDGDQFHFANLPIKNINYLQLLKKRLDNSSKFFIDQILEEEKDVPYYQRIKIPVGESNGRRIYFETSTESKPYPFSIVTGSTGSGKSAFIHTLMMSAAYKYSPQEVEIHLVDFKSADKSTDFDGYRYVPNKENLYIPHIKYVSLKSRPENAVDVTNYIIKLMAERSRYGKFEEYNRHAKPEDRIPQIYVIIDEYENMIKGGDGLDDNSIEKINLVSQINTNIETILKRARVFGIGVIFAGQDFTLKGKAPNQINTRFAFFNSESTLRASFPNPIDNFSKFPSDKRQSVGYCYVGSEGDENPQYAHIAYAGGVDSERLANLARKIREKYPEETKKHIQTVIGGSGSVIPEKGSYPLWKDEIEAIIESTKMSFDSDEEFYSSGSEQSIKKFRPLVIGQSSSSNMMIPINYANDTGKFGYFAFASKISLARIESNAMLAFLYQTGNKGKIAYLDASYDGMKKEIIDDYKAVFPDIEKHIKYISNVKQIGRTLIEINKGLKENNKPQFIVLNGLDFLLKEKSKEWLKFDEPETKEVVNEVKEANFQKEKQELESKSNIKVSPLLAGFLGGIKSNAVEKIEEHEKKDKEVFTLNDVLEALKNIYVNGSRNEVYILVGAESYLAINKVLFDNLKEFEKDILRYAIYDSFDTFKSKNVDAIPNANIAYIFNDKTASTVRLFNYLAKESSSWWEELKENLKEN